MVETSYVSDAYDIPADALMDEPFATITIDLSHLSVAEQVSVVDQVGPEKLRDDEHRASYGAVKAGGEDEPWMDLQIVLHADVGGGINLLHQLGLMGDETPDDDLREAEDD